MNTLEVVDKNRNFNEYCKMLQTALESFKIVYKLHDTIKNTPAKDFEKIQKSVNLTFEHHKVLNGDYSKSLNFTCEEYGYLKQRQVALEGIGSWLSKIWQMISNFFKKIWDFLFGKKERAKVSFTYKKVPDTKRNNENVKKILEHFIFLGDSPSDYNRNSLEYTKILNSISDQMEYSLNRCMEYEECLTGKLKIEDLAENLKRNSKINLASMGFKSINGKDKETVVGESCVIFGDITANIELPNFTNLKKEDLSNILKFYGNQNKIIRFEEEEKLEKFRKDTVFNETVDGVNDLLNKFTKNITFSKKEKEKIEKEAEPFVKKIAQDNFFERNKNKIENQIENQSSEEDRLKNLPGLMADVGKGFIAEIRHFNNLTNLYESVIYFGDIHYRRINDVFLMASIAKF